LLRFLLPVAVSFDIHTDYKPNGDNKWEIDDGIRGLKNLEALADILEPYEVPRDLDVPGSRVPVHSGIIILKFCLQTASMM
jgi:hypothetical protein